VGSALSCELSVDFGWAEYLLACLGGILPSFASVLGLLTLPTILCSVWSAISLIWKTEEQDRWSYWRDRVAWCNTSASKTSDRLHYITLLWMSSEGDCCWILAILLIPKHSDLIEII
jgi:hypothetical protein